MALSFLRRGRDAQKLKREADKRDSLAKARRDAPRRFWVPEDKTVRITFLDGNIRDGMLDAPTYNEHRVRRNGQTEYYPCLTGLDERCPLCEDGEKVSLVSVYTVLDHSKWKDREGKTHQHERRLYVVNRDVAKKLERLAAKRGGLEGCTFEVSRSGSYSPSVGNTFEFVGKRTLAQIRTKYGLRPDDVKPFDYDSAIRLYTTEELESLGFGSGKDGDDARGRRSRDDDDDKPSKSRRASNDDDDDADDHLDDIDESDFDDDDEKPAKSKGKGKPVDDDDVDDDAEPADDDDEDEEAEESEESDEDDEDDDPPPARKKARRKPDPDDDESDEESDDDGLGDDDDSDDEDDDKFPPRRTDKPKPGPSKKKLAKKRRSILRD